ncbi:alpha/beta fold hydrolase [Pseudooceanicola sp. LIPI14-2-Ac024]|uniref:alpha/beta fold hydrolase n=1 Tax=Pseudooceanicola sp. LIPI14-2-Ac024 TaxID=3344875 RepID=UPI0035CF3919
MALRVLYLHGAGAAPGDAPFDTIRTILGPAEVVAPQLADPEPEAWATVIAEALDDLPEDAILIGHSLGASMLLQVLARRRPVRRAPAVFAFASPFWGAPGWDHAGFALPEDLGGLDGVGEMFLYHGTADTVVAPDHGDRYAARLGRARVRRVAGADHCFEGADLAVFATDLRKILT